MYDSHNKYIENTLIELKKQQKDLLDEEKCMLPNDQRVEIGSNSSYPRTTLMNTRECLHFVSITKKNAVCIFISRLIVALVSFSSTVTPLISPFFVFYVVDLSLPPLFTFYLFSCCRFQLYARIGSIIIHIIVQTKITTFPTAFLSVSLCILC